MATGERSLKPCRRGRHRVLGPISGLEGVRQGGGFARRIQNGLLRGGGQRKVVLLDVFQTFSPESGLLGVDKVVEGVVFDALADGFDPSYPFLL